MKFINGNKIDPTRVIIIAVIVLSLLIIAYAYWRSENYNIDRSHEYVKFYYIGGFLALFWAGIFFLEKHARLKTLMVFTSILFGTYTIEIVLASVSYRPLERSVIAEQNGVSFDKRSKIAKRDKEEEKQWLQRDPLTTYPARLIELGVLDQAALDHIRAKAKAVVEGAANRLTQTEPGSNQLHVVPDMWPSATTVEYGIRGDLSELDGQRYMEAGDMDPADTKEMKLIEAMAAVQLRAMERDERVFVLGEDVHHLKGGTVGATKGIAEKFPDRLTI
mgnify:CR=1 FL=1